MNTYITRGICGSIIGGTGFVLILVLKQLNLDSILSFFLGAGWVLIAIGVVVVVRTLTQQSPSGK